MKASKFNIFFPYEDGQIGFNSFSEEYITLESLLYDMYDASYKSKDFEELKAVHPAFYDFLCDKGFLVDEATDEIENVRQRSMLVDNDDALFELVINPTMNCNFKCWYCYETHIKDSKMDSVTIDKTVKFIENVFSQRKGLKAFNLIWFGGEPLLYFSKVVLPLLKVCHSLASASGITFTSSMTTNGLLLNEETVAHSKAYGLDFFQITLDGDRERHDKVRFISEGKGSYDKIVEHIKLVAHNKLTALVRINCSVETLPGLESIIDDFMDVDEEDKRYIKFDIHKVWQVDENIDDQLNHARIYFRQKGFQVNSVLLNSVKQSCYADRRNHATINYNGEVFKCTARDFKTPNSEGLLNDDGMIDWNEKYEKRLQIKFKNKPCLECAILPICGGGCTQQALEHEGVDYCVHNFDEEEKLKLVKNKFFEITA